jgi:cytidylate kinase
MTTITISRQLGSYGDEVAQALAARLGYRVVCRDLINQAALRAGAPELALATIDDLGLLGIRPDKKARRAYKQALDEIMHEMANEGETIIVGRAGQVILAERQDVLHIKVMAPRKLRARRIAQQEQIPFKSALARVKASDRSRKQFLKRNYKARWDDPALYDLVVNTTRLNPDQAAGLIFRALDSCLTDNIEDDIQANSQQPSG